MTMQIPPREILSNPPPLIYGSVCSGIEAASVAWHPLGWKPAFFSEIEAFPRAVLQRHYPNIPLHGDFTTIKDNDYAAIDLLIGGTPCQAFSVAGLRKGFADERGNLTLEFVRLAQRLKPRWLVWENVPGVLSIDRGRAFGSFLGGLAECGYGFAYRVLDAQHFGVPQRRRRVFVVGYLGDWRPPAAVLFERENLRGDHTPSRKAGEKPAPAISERTKGGGGLGTDFDLDGGLIAHSLRAEGFDASEDGTGRGTPLVPVAFDVRNALAPHGSAGISDTAFPLKASDYKEQQIVAFSCKDFGADASTTAPAFRAMGHAECHANSGGQLAVAFESRFARNGRGAPSDIVPPLKAQSGQSGKGDAAPLVMSRMQVRRLMPRECERLQGFPDDFTLVPYRGKPAADGPRYMALGNSMAVPCMRWIGERIESVRKVQSRLVA